MKKIQGRTKPFLQSLLIDLKPTRFPAADQCPYGRGDQAFLRNNDAFSIWLEKVELYSMADATWPMNGYDVSHLGCLV